MGRINKSVSGWSFVQAGQADLDGWLEEAASSRRQGDRYPINPRHFILYFIIYTSSVSPLSDLSPIPPSLPHSMCLKAARPQNAFSIFQINLLNVHQEKEKKKAECLV